MARVCADERHAPMTAQLEGGRMSRPRVPLVLVSLLGLLPQFGYPISEVFEERLEDGKTYRVQYFERARFEYHPENQAPYDVLLGQFGRKLHPLYPAVADCRCGRYFAETGHNIAGRFQAYWEANGGLAQFGYPITDQVTETLEDGHQYTVQWFERAR